MFDDNKEVKQDRDKNRNGVLYGYVNESDWRWENDNDEELKEYCVWMWMKWWSMCLVVIGDWIEMNVYPISEEWEVIEKVILNPLQKIWVW